MRSHRRIICQTRSCADAWMIRCQSRVADAVAPELENGRSSNNRRRQPYSRSGGERSCFFSRECYVRPALMLMSSARQKEAPAEARAVLGASSSGSYAWRLYLDTYFSEHGGDLTL
jgi:hypothetical protein